jgi:hypothetical protein
MNETGKTLVFVGIAVLSLIVAFATQPSSASLDVTKLIGQKLPTFSPEDAKRLKVVEYDEDTATLRDFEVAEDEIGLWTIPSKMGYPADAEQQMGEAATCVMDREILAVASNNAADHEQFGVIDPDSPDLIAGQEGVGTRVTISDINNKELIDLIIGKEVKDAEDQHYVRQEKQDAVYVININPDKLSTKFEDWIEKDLLKLNPWDILLGGARVGGIRSTDRLGSARRIYAPI